MSHAVVSREEWLEARRALLLKEKAHTRARDALNVERMALPWVKLDKAYVFDTDSGRKSLAELFDGRNQLIIYHFMFHPEWDDGCPSCTAGVDEVSRGFVDHLEMRDTTYALVSRAPLTKLERYKAKRGWFLPWYSSGEGDFNYDFGVTIDASRGFDTYNFRTLDEYAAMGHESMKTAEQPYDMPGQSCFLQDDGRVEPEGELERWKERDPIKIYRERLKQFGVSEQVMAEIDAEVRREVDEATEACKAAPMPPTDILFTDVYADGGWAWRN